MLTACQYGSFEVKEGGNDSDSLAIHIAVLPTKECAPFCIAQECGLYDSLGISVIIDTFAAAMDADTAFVNGDVHILVSDSLKMGYFQQQFASDSVMSILTDSLRLSLLTSKPARIKSIKNLKEKIIAVTRNSAIDYYADQVMDKAKIKREYLNRPQINNIELRANMLNLNQYDGAILPEPFATMCEEAGAVRVTSSSEPLLRILVRKQTYTTRKADIDKIIEAYKTAKKNITDNVK